MCPIKSRYFLQDFIQLNNLDNGLYVFSQYVVDPGTFSINLTISLDVIIGTVPLYNLESVVPRVTNPSNPQIGFQHWVIPNKYGNEPTAPMARKFVFFKKPNIF